MPARFELFLFDLDGTLVASAPEICDAVNDTLRRFEMAQVSQQQVDDWIGQGTRELLVQALAFSTAVPADTVRASKQLAGIAAAFDGYYQSRCGTRSHLYPQVRQSLVALRARGAQLAVVTNKEARYTRTVLDVHGLTPLLDGEICGDSLPTKKPDPAGVQACLQRFGVAAARALFVGDSSIDVATARNAGIAVWAVPYGYNMGQPIADCKPDRVIADLSFLLTN